MRPSLRLLPLVLAAALAGCGQSQSSTADFNGAEQDVAETIEQLETTAQARDPEEICSEVLAGALVERVKTSGNDCVDEMETVVGDADDFALEVTDVTITGTTATARVKGRKGGKDDAVTTFALANEDGKWRLTDFGSS